MSISMDHKKLMETTVCQMDEPAFELLKELIPDKYISFRFIKYANISQPILAEKLCDHFSMVELKTGRSLNKQIEAYFNDLDSIVGPWVAKVPAAKKGETATTDCPRARKYYDKVSKYKNNEVNTVTLRDYTRIMLCLYMARLNNKGKTISDFNYAIDCLDAKMIIESFKKEEVEAVFTPTKKRFNLSDKYSSDACTLLLLMIILCAIIDSQVKGEHKQ